MLCAFTTGRENFYSSVRYVHVGRSPNSTRILILDIYFQYFHVPTADNWVAQLTIFLLGRFFATYAMNVGFQFTVEVMPTSVLYCTVLY